MSVNKKTALDILGKLVNLSKDESKEYQWILNYLESFMKEKGVEGEFSDLLPTDRDTLINSIISELEVKGQTIPDYLTTYKSGIDNSVNNPPAVVTQSEDADVKVLKDKLESANDRLEVAKQLLKDMDLRVTKFESLDYDSMMELLDRYESLGTPEDIALLIDKLESEKETQEKGAVATTPETKQSESDSDSTQKGDNMSKANEKDDKVKTENEVSITEDQLELLKKYQELGTLDEIEELLERFKDLSEESEDMSEKLESVLSENELLNGKLESYQSIGEPDELATAITHYGELRQKVESERIATEFNISPERANSLIDKLESVTKVEEVLMELKGESALTTTADEPALLDKQESDQSQSTGRPQLDTQRKTQLSQLIRRL